jgi:PilZ domain
MEQELRRAPRFRLIAPAELVDETSGTRITAYMTDLNLYGCAFGVRHPPPKGMTILLEIVTPSESFKSRATVVHSHVHSVGVTFWNVKPHALTVLRSWLATAMRDPQEAEGSS